MAYYLYTLTAYNNTANAMSLTTEGVTAIVEMDFNAGAAAQNNSGMVIDAVGSPHNGEPPGYLAQGVGIALPQNPFYRVNQGAGAYAGVKDYFGLIIGNTETTSTSTWASTIGATSEEDWDGTGKTLTWHSPSLTPDTYTLIVPTDNVVYQTLPQRSGNVLVWHVPYGDLGVYGQNANLPSNAAPVDAADLDDKAAAKIWAMGFGLISESGISLPYLQIA